VIAPSQGVADRVRRHLPAVRVLVGPHPETANHGAYPCPEARVLCDQEPLRIAVLGALGPIKGADVLEACAVDARSRNLDLEFHLLGYAYRSLIAMPESRLVAYGPYADEDLSELLQSLKPHVVWFPSQAPETFSYTLSVALRAGLPVAASDLGAIAERLAGRPWSWVRPWQSPPEVWNDFFLTIRREHFLTGQQPAPCSKQERSRGFDYAADYLKTPRRDHAVQGELHSQPLASHAYEPLSMNARLRIATLRALVRLRSTRLARPVFRWIPLPWQRRVRTWLAA
jgi:O-antigen biosynthesis protein